MIHPALHIPKSEAGYRRHRHDATGYSSVGVCVCVRTFGHASCSEGSQEDEEETHTTSVDVQSTNNMHGEHT